MKKAWPWIAGGVVLAVPGITALITTASYVTACSNSLVAALDTRTCTEASAARWIGIVLAITSVVLIAVGAIRLRRK